MTVHIKCGGCKKVLTGPDNLAGQRVKCPQCGAILRIPAAQTDGDRDAPQPSSDDSLASFLDEEGFDSTPIPPASTANACPNCGSELPSGGVLCTKCGFHKELGQQLETEHEARTSVADVVLARARAAIKEEERRSPIKKPKMNPTVQAWIMGGLGAVVLGGIILIGFSRAGGVIDFALFQRAFMALALLLSLGGRCSVTYTAAQSGHTVSAIGSFFCGPYAVVYAILNFDTCKYPLVVILIGWALTGFAIALTGG